MATFLPQEIIRLKRDGVALTEAQIDRFVKGIADNSVTDAQIAAFAMAVFLNGMTAGEGAALTLAMRDSGDVMDWTRFGFDVDAPIVDKHSTGGVGDKVSLMLAPIVAACGGFVPMISGRGLGHSGGTLDKLEAVPGYDPYPPTDRFAAITRDVGCAIIGQTGQLAPADKRFYAVRDVTGTVESVPLITASILSKKLAAGLNALVMDVKVGNGAFMATLEDGRRLADSIVAVAGAAGTPVTALLTDMNEVLGRTAGNAVEMLEAVEFLRNPAGAEPRLREVTLALAAHMLMLSGVVSAPDDAAARVAGALDGGAAAEVFARMIAAQGGPADFVERAEAHLPLAPVVLPVTLGRSGFIAAMDTRAIGMAVVALGGGRTDPAQAVDHGVGLCDVRGCGTYVSADDPVAIVHARSDAAAADAAASVRTAVRLSATAPVPVPVVAATISGADAGPAAPAVTGANR